MYDEDVSTDQSAEEDKKPDDQEKTREQREAELLPRVTEALKLGTNVIDVAFEKLDTSAVDSDSEDEDSGYRPEPILEAKVGYDLKHMKIRLINLYNTLFNFIQWFMYIL